MGKRVAVIGASGFVGTTFVERSLQDGAFEVVPIIHSSGGAWRLIRHGIAVRTANLLDKDSLAAALRDCTHVVNCSRGGSDVMLGGLSNLLRLAAEARIEGFVHLSSVMVYGDLPTPGSTSEGAATPPQPPTTYGGLKQRQDEMVCRAASAGLPALILCPPNISGPYSSFVGAVLDNLARGTLGLVEAGNTVCNLADVDNFAHAIILALDHCSKKAERLFITDDEDVCWGQLVAALQPLCPEAGAPPAIAREELVRLRDEQTTIPPVKPLRALKHLVSSDVRAALRKDPLWAKIDTALRSGIAKLGTAVESNMRLAIEGPIGIAKAPNRPLNVPLTAQQLRGVRHSCARAKEVIGYRPQHSFAESMRAYCAWYRSHTGQNSPSWALARYLQ